jgi:hypothetical protein
LRFPERPFCRDWDLEVISAYEPVLARRRRGGAAPAASIGLSETVLSLVDAERFGDAVPAGSLDLSHL